MKWITRSHVHVDRVACPWLIARFVDSEAEFIFVPKSQVIEIAETELSLERLLKKSSTVLITQILEMITQMYC